MANISSYPLITPKASDLILVTETYDINAASPVTGNPTRSATVASIAAEASAINLGYKSYTALITQSGVTAPVATVLQNTLGGDFTWGYTSAGLYTLTSSTSAFTTNKTILFANHGNVTGSQDEIAWGLSNSSVMTFNLLGQNGRITNGSFEIKVYE